jgi:antirestriction protein ArdC
MKEKHIIVTERIIAELEGGCAPWVRPWKDASLPRNVLTRRCYSGVNVIELWMAQSAVGYPHAEWLSFRQALQLGGCVRKGEKGTPIFFYRVLEREDEKAKGGVKRIPLLRSYTVFNIAQCDGIKPAEEIIPKPAERLATTDAFIAKIGALVRHGGSEAYYSPLRDEITLPPFERFEAPEHYYATSCHEHSHWSGAKHRLAREFGKRFGDDAYAFEELIAELTSAYLCAELGIPGTLRHPEYLASWVRVLRADTRALFTAGARASQAADYLARLGGLRSDDPAEEEPAQAA